MIEDAKVLLGTGINEELGCLPGDGELSSYRFAKLPVPSSVSHRPLALPFRM
jgi:hypothetical protein